ncbi:putative membrane protein (DUF2142) [Frankia torreyi]|uniref:Putative membrane protein (DUF2142) n=1 Tax=Frankia torreyi TaxID=1856 RepID=A0A0D8BII6_9ACTN|nr:putative membrane protein (DUF2142) [Frankia torreyi]
MGRHRSTGPDDDDFAAGRTAAKAAEVHGGAAQQAAEIHGGASREAAGGPAGDAPPGAAGRGPAMRRWFVTGVAAAGLIFSSLGLLVAAVVPPFTGADEAQHTAYALELAHGSLPQLDTPVRARVPGMPGLPASCRASPAQARAAVDAHADGLCGVRLGRGLSNFDLVYTANHPPLFYAVEAVPLRTGEASGHPLAGFRAARVVNVLLGVGVVVATAALCRGLLPRRPGVAVGAAAVIGTVGLVVVTSGQIYNDTLAMATVTGLLAVTVALARRGPSPRILAGLAVLGPAAAASRASGAVALAAVVPAVAAAVALHTRGSRARRAGRGLAAAGGLLALTVAAVGWFYLRNQRRYGDPTASERIADMFPLGGAHPSIWQVLRNGDLWWYVYRGFFGRPTLVTGHAEQVAVGIAVVTGAGLAAAALRACARRRSTGGAPSPSAADPSGGSGGGGGSSNSGGGGGGAVVGWLLVAGHCLLVVATLVGYVAAGGASFTRYLLPMAPVLAIGVAASCRALPLGRHGLPTLAVVAAMAACTLVLIGRELAWKRPALAPLALPDRLRAAWALGGPGSPRVGLAVLAAAAIVAAALLAAALGKLGDPAVDGRGQLRGAPPGEGAGVGAARLGVAGGGEQGEDRLGEVVGERVPVGLPDQPHRAGDGVDQGSGDLPDGRDVGGDDRGAGGERFQGR